jgi:hypothetical protein
MLIFDVSLTSLFSENGNTLDDLFNINNITLVTE